MTESVNTIVAWSDGGSHFKCFEQFIFLKTINHFYSVNFILNFFEPGDGKSDMDRHFGKLKAIEKSFLLHFDEIEGKFF